MSDARALFYIGLSTMSGAVVLTGFLYGPVAVFLTIVAAFAMLMTCVSLDVVYEGMKREGR